jgi:dipeptidyl aminopeptidase/acylaminoacyl peptidase
MRSSCFIVVLIAGCASTPAPTPPGPPPAPRASVVAEEIADAAPADVHEPPAWVAPSVLTLDERTRDDALTPAASNIVSAYANVNGPFSSLVARLTRDGKRVLFGSLRAGMQQIYLGDVAHPEAAPLALTTGTERAMWASFTRDEQKVLFTRDEGADENWRVYSVGLDGTGVTCLTPGPKRHRDEPLLPRNQADTMVYTSHETSSPASQLVVQPISGGEPRVVYEDPAPANASDVTADGGRALLVRFNSASDLVVLEVDTHAGKAGNPAERIYPPEGTKATVEQAVYSPDGRIVYVATDEGKEGGALLAIDAKTKIVKARYAMDDIPTAALTFPFVSPLGDRIVVLVNAGNHDEIRVLDGRTLRLQRKLDTPLGSAGTGPFTPDGKSFVYWLSTPNHPAEIYLADAATGRSKPLRKDTRPGLDALPTIDVSIATTPAKDGLTIPLNVYRPAAAGDAKRPVIVWFHGGPSNSSAVRWHAFLRFFTSTGYIVVEPNVRGSTGFGRSFERADNGAKRVDVLGDMETVNAWVKAQSWCDASRVIVFGGSYGGYITLMALTREPTLWRAGVDLFGIANLKTFMRSTDSAIRSMLTEEFGDAEKDAALLDEFSPSRDFGKIAAPLFVYAGANDPRVPRSESDQIVAEMRRRGVPVEYMIAPNEGHSVDRTPNRIEFMTRVVRFLNDHIK